MPRPSQNISPQAMELYASFCIACIDDPLLWAEKAYPWGVEGTPLEGRKLHEWQRKVLSTMRDDLGKMRRGEKPWGPIRIATKSGHGIGKSALVGIVNDWAMATMVDSRAITTANTEEQLRKKTWPELAKWHLMSVSRTFFEWTATTLFSNDPDHAQNWQATATPWSERNYEAFQGLHNAGRRVVVIFDEASAIPAIIWEAIEGAQTDDLTQIVWLVFGNPTRNSGRFYECFGKRKKFWHRVTVDSREVEGTNLELFKEWAEQYGDDSDFFRIRVKGEFPAVSALQFIGRDIVERAMGRKPYSRDDDPLVCGIDFARNGNCNNVMYWRKGRDGSTWKPDIYPDDPTSSHFIAKCAERLKDMRPDVIYGDGVGVGGPIIDRLNELGFNVVDVQAASRSVEPDRHANKRAEMWVKGKHWIRDGGSLWDNADFVSELCTIENMPHPKGLTLLEAKESLLKRGEPSPDVADAFMLTFAYETTEAAAAEYQQHHANVQSNAEFNQWEGLDVMRDEEAYDKAGQHRKMRTHYVGSNR